MKMRRSGLFIYISSICRISLLIMEIFRFPFCVFRFPSFFFPFYLSGCQSLKTGFCLLGNTQCRYLFQIHETSKDIPPIQPIKGIHSSGCGRIFTTALSASSIVTLARAKAIPPQDSRMLGLRSSTPRRD